MSDSTDSLVFSSIDQLLQEAPVSALGVQLRDHQATLPITPVA